MSVETLLRELGPVTVLTGEDRFGIEELVGRCRSAFAELAMAQMNTKRLYGDVKAERIIEAASALPAFAPARFVEWRSTGGAAAHRVLKDLQPYLEAPNPTTLMLLVIPEKVDGRMSAVKSAKRLGYIKEMKPPGPGQVARWITARCDRLGVNIEPGAVDALIDVTGTDRMDLVGELDKFVLSVAEGEPITSSLVRSSAHSVLEEDVWILAEHLAYRREAQAHALSLNLLEEGVAAVSLIAGLTYHFKGLARLALARSEGHSGRALERASGLPAKRQRKLGRQPNLWGGAAAAEALIALARADSRLKGGWRLGPAATLQALCAELCRA